MKIETTPAGRRIVAEEDLTADHIAGQRDFLADCLADAAGGLILDLEAVKVVDGRGLALLAGLAVDCEARSLTLRLEGLRPELRQLLELCQLRGAVEITGMAVDG